MSGPERPRLRIAFFHLGFFYAGGGEKLVLEEINGLRSLGHQVTCYAPIVDRDSCFPELMADTDVRPLLPQPPRWLPLRDIMWIVLCSITIPLMSWRFRNYDILLGANQPGPWFAWVLSRMLGKPYVIYLNQPNRLLYPRAIDLENGLRVKEGDYRIVEMVRRFARPIIEWADRTSVIGAHAMLADGEYIGSQLGSIYGLAVTNCPAGCHPAPEVAIGYAHRWKGNLEVSGVIIHKPFVLLTNRHYPQKRFDYAIEAMPSLLEQACEFSLVITGEETAYTYEMRELVRSRDLEGKVHFLGLVSESDLDRLYEEAALYVYTSPDEDFGMGIIEAMAHGTPVVAWNHGGPTVSVEDGITGLLATPGDGSDFALKMVRLAMEPELAEQLGRGGHRRAQSMFSYERHCQILERSLLEALATYGRVPEAADAPIAGPTWVRK